MQLPNYKILSSSEAKDLFKQEDTKRLINAVRHRVRDKNFTFHHVAQQQIGKIRLDFLNCTDYVVCDSPELKMMINNKLTKLIATPDDCQMLIIADNDYIYFYNSDIGTTEIICPYCNKGALQAEDLTQIMWESKINFSKESTG
jgi:hypothetical protein